MKNNTTQLFLIIIGGLTVLISVILVVTISIQNRNLKEQLSLQSSQFESQLPNIQEEVVDQSEKYSLKEKEINYFVENILPQYPQLENISEKSILNIRAFHLKGSELGDESTGWLVETEDNEKKSYYLISSLVQKKLVDVMVPYAGENAVCSLTKVVTTGNERGLGRELSDKNGYIVIAVENCESYGEGNSISVYTLSTGEKIKITGNFLVAGSTRNGTTSLGTATGKLVGVYGVNNPQVVVSYGNDLAKGTVEEVRQIAFFDLQTGKLIRVENFK